METLELNGAWRLQQNNNKKNKHENRKTKPDPIPAMVPGCVHTDLLAARAIDDPFFRDNENRLQWIGMSEWIYSRSFDVHPELLAHDRVMLQCKGLDTLATITINGKRVGKTDNMFREYEFNVKRYLHPGRNRIAIRFASAVKYVRSRQKNIKMNSWGQPGCETGRAWLRKEPCNFGWDWGPCLVTCGIWRPIRILAYNTARLDDIHVLQYHSPRNKVKLKVKVGAEIIKRVKCRAAITITHAGKTVAESEIPLRAGKGSASVNIPNPQLWWPNNMGRQPLYDVSVELLDHEGNLLNTESQRIGLRTLELERKNDRWGESFQFKINGISFFAKGANWIPADTFVTRLQDADYRRLVSDAAAANMNMLRVWGGGIYEQDVFYNLCDELGICVWQDFMFACSTYPAFDRDFMDNVKAEAEDNIRRLRHHPCLALWCGNNELEQGLVANERTDKTMSWQDYRALFDKLLPALVKKIDPERDYWPGSPHSPHGDRADHRNPTCGDAHLWEVWHGRKPFEWYRTCKHRFCSEFGFQSFPEPRTVTAYTLPKDRNVTSFIMEHHQRSGIGNTTIMQYMLDWFRLPNNFDKTLWLTQIQHGMAMKYAVEHWRRNMPRSMGTLYWQINDCWPVASWASIDSFGRWKALHYMARHFYQPLLVSGVEEMDRGIVQVHITSDLLQLIKGKVRWSATDLRGRELAHGSRPAAIKPRQSRLVCTIDLKREASNYDPRNILLWLDLSIRNTLINRNLVLMARPKHLELETPKIRAGIRKLDDSLFAIELKTRKPALWTWIEFTGMDNMDTRLSDNFFHLRPGEPLTIQVATQEPTTVTTMKNALKVSSLIDTYT